MSKAMLINVSAGEECRIAVVDNNRLQELYMERNSTTSHVGNIYKGKVTNVEPSIQAAFIDFGIGRNGFLHISDLMPTYFGKGRDYVEKVGQKLGRRDRPPIQSCLRRGDEIIVQIIKEGIGTKGPTLTTYLSVPGRVLVMMPGMQKMGVSKKIEDEDERRRLRTILDSLDPPEDCGFIIRTAGVGKSKIEIERDLKYLARLWETVKKIEAKAKGPTELYTEGDLVTRTVRDVFTADVERIVCDDANIAKKVKDFIKLSMPRTKNKVELYEEHVPLFHKFGIEKEIEQMYSRTVPLPSGGSLVIDSTEAVVAIDVNSGKFREHNDAEMTAFKTDMEAAEEIPRQLKLRDLGGVIICDFIDLRFERHRKELEQKLYDKLKDDRAKTRMLRMSQFGIVEMTRQRMRPSLKRSIYHDCPACKGAGLVKTAESMSLDVMRKLSVAAADARVVRIQLSVGAETAFNLLNKKRDELVALEGAHEKKIVVLADATLAIDECKIELFDTREGLVFISELGMSPQQHGAAIAAAPGRGGKPESRNSNPRKNGRGGEDDVFDADDLRGGEDEEESPAQPQGRGSRDRDGARENDLPVIPDLRRKRFEAPVDAPAAMDEGDGQDQEEEDDESTVSTSRRGGDADEESEAHRQAERELAQAEEDEESEEASDVIDVDDTDESEPLPAADAFFDPNSREHREQRDFANRRPGGPRNGQNRDQRGRDNRQGGRDNRPQQGGRNDSERNDRQNNRPNQNRGPQQPQPNRRDPQQSNRPRSGGRPNNVNRGPDDQFDEDNRGNRVPDPRAKHSLASKPVYEEDDDRGNRVGPPVNAKPSPRDLRNPARLPSHPSVELNQAPPIGQDEHELDAEIPSPGNEAMSVDAAVVDTGDRPPKKRRRRRGGRGRRRGGNEDGQGQQNGPEGLFTVNDGGGGYHGDDSDSPLPEEADPSLSALQDADEDASGEVEDVSPPAPSRFSDPIVPISKTPKPAKPAAPRRSTAATRVPPPIPVVKTGSTDRHLVDDEPIAPPEPRLPSSSRDLDDLPEYDDD